MHRLLRFLSKRHGHQRPPEPRLQGKVPKSDHRDIAAMIIALFQLFAPLVLALLGVGLVVSVILLNIR